MDLKAPPEFATYHAELVRFLRPRLGPHTSKDVAQEAYLRLLEARSSSPIRDARAFLFTVASNIATDRERHSRRWHTQEIEESESEARLPVAPGADRVVAARQELQTLQQAILELPPRCRAAFIMLRIEGATYRQIAVRLSCSETMARKYAARALEHCYARLEWKQE